MGDDEDVGVDEREDWDVPLALTGG